MAATEARSDLYCACQHGKPSARLDWWRRAEVILDYPVRKEGDHPGGPSEWSCRKCRHVVERPSPLQIALDALPMRKRDRVT